MMNLLQLFFTGASLFFVIFGFLIFALEPYLPKFLMRAYKFGKFAEQVDYSLVMKIEVPKRWFQHFYLFATGLSIFVLVQTIGIYFFNGTAPKSLCTLFDFLFGKRQALVSAECTILALILFSFHVCKRCYESYYVSVYSDAKMNLLHYLLAFVHYAGTIFSLVGEGEGFVNGTNATFKWSKIAISDIVAAGLFIWAVCKQYETNVILANLRKNDKDEVITKGYKIPHGGHFEYISSPLQYFEIILYISLSVILWSSQTFHYVTVWVCLNQAACALFSQQWYHRTFKNYPKSRKILIPFLL